MKKYYDVHVFYSRKDGFSIGVEIELLKNRELSDEEILQYCIDNNLLDSEDANYVDYIEEIDLEEYLNLTF